MFFYEFRCYVLNDKLIAISQRYADNYYQFLVKEKEELRDKITQFFNVVLKSTFYVKNYVFDAYISKKRKVHLIGINPWGYVTTLNPSLFDWDELLLLKTEDDKPEIRIIENQFGIKLNESFLTGLPLDLHDKSEAFEEFIKNQMENGNLKSDSEDSNDIETDNKEQNDNNLDTNNLTIEENNGDKTNMKPLLTDNTKIGINLNTSI